MADLDDKRPKFCQWICHVAKQVCKDLEDLLRPAEDDGDGGPHHSLRFILDLNDDEWVGKTAFLVLWTRTDR